MAAPTGGQSPFTWQPVQKPPPQPAPPPQPPGGAGGPGGPGGAGGAGGAGGPAAPPAAQQVGDKTTISATFVEGGKTYKITIGYNEQALRQTYNIANNIPLEDEIKSIVNQLVIADLVSMAGQSVKATFGDQQQPISSDHTYVKIGAANEQTLTALAQNPQQQQLHTTIVKVISAFATHQYLGQHPLQIEVREQSALPQSQPLPPANLPPSSPPLVNLPSSSNLPTDLSIKFQKASPTEYLHSMLMTGNPLGADDQLLALIDNMNTSNNMQSLAQIGRVINSHFPIEKRTPKNKQYIDDVVNLIENENARNTLKIQMDVLKKGDIVSDISQGQLDEVDGPTACATICGLAIQKLAGGTGINTQADLNNLLTQGVEHHKSKQRNRTQKGPIEFTEVFKELNDDKLNIDTEYNDGINRESDSDLYIPYSGSIKGDKLPNLIGGITEGKFGVITFYKGGNVSETVLVYRQDDKLMLLDSHGRPYFEMDKGASVRQFDSANELFAYFKSVYTRYSDTVFSMSFVGVKGAGEE